MRDTALEEDEESWYHANSTPMMSRMLPLLTWNQAEKWTELLDNFKPADARIWIPCLIVHGPRAFALTVTDESMYNPAAPRSFASGDYIYVDPDAGISHESIIVVKRDNGNLVFRQLIVEPDGKALFKAINPDWPEAPFEARRETEICGVVIGKTLP
ncbi:S24 family peptidase [Oxalobacter vibrioformis]|uniref:S24 family peptidase n=1 Tax=Oxalobacter vibrioformis TaxID=933080 RepID=A0A9E9LZT5_9BURK|nr:S24 family peptidase [Oxalobacter vibrioformis]NLC24967.1 S24 family peptidase [Oxalobacter sp.]WAW10552.1 S24 family peptidase [Oxalobacter vibrioformis]